MEVSETRLPGVGLRHEFVTEDGERMGVITHRTGRRELVVYERHDPDATRESLVLTSDEAGILADLLGGTSVTESVDGLQHQIAGLAIDWLKLPERRDWKPRSIGDAKVRQTTGVSIVAILRGDDAIPAPGPEERLQAGDTVVVVGTPAGIRATIDLLAD